MTTADKAKAAARAAFDAKYPAPPKAERKKPAARLALEACARILSPEPEPEIVREPRLLGAPRNGGHEFDLRDNYLGSPDFVDEWDRRARAFRSGAAYADGAL